MIRHRDGSTFILFTQDDHAILAGQLAERIAGGSLAPPSAATIRGIALHDAGWTLHDRAPTLNPGGEPLHVFETPPAIATRVWGESARIAAEADPYAGLLVSLHVLALSATSMSSHPSTQDQFELNKFQHRQIELQESLRRQLGMRVDLPLTHGLARPHASPSEDALLFDFRLLRAMDQLSLALLCSEELFPALGGLYARPGGAEVSIPLTRPRPMTVRLDAWPFDADQLECQVPARRVPARAYGSNEAFRETFGGVAPEQITVRVLRG